LFGQENLLRDWNNDLQSLYEWEPVFSPYELQQANLKKESLVSEFVHFTGRIAEALIKQKAQPVDQWKIQPLKTQVGVAGGEKFVVGNIFCKFVTAENRVYKGNFELAIKMAQNEIRNSNAVLKLGIAQLHLSLMASHRLWGFAVITTAIMPVSPPQTLVYGSNDAALTLLKRSTEMCASVERVASLLGLAAHAVRGHAQDFLVSIGADCEGHVSKQDGRH